MPSERTVEAKVKLATWNVNSLAVRLPQLLDWLNAHQPDAMVLQETKLTDDKFPAAEIAAAGYRAQWFGQKTYNGVALLSRATPATCVRNIPGFADELARVITGTVDGVRIVGAYVPNGQAPGTDKFEYKMRWLRALRGGCATELAAHPRLVLIGDFNIAPEDRDVHDPVAWAGQILCTPKSARTSQSWSSWAWRCVPAVRATAQELELVGLSQPGVSQEPGAAHGPHPGERRAESHGRGSVSSTAAAQERAAQRPRAGDGQLRD